MEFKRFDYVDGVSNINTRFKEGLIVIVDKHGIAPYHVAFVNKDGKVECHWCYGLDLKLSYEVQHREMTVEEISKELGYEVKIVK